MEHDSSIWMNGQTTCTRKNKLIHVFLLPLETLMFQWPTVAHFRAGVDKLYIYSPTGTIYFTNRWWVRCFTLDFTFFFCPLFELQNSKPSVKIHRPKERSGQCLTGSGQQMIFFHWSPIIGCTDLTRNCYGFQRIQYQPSLHHEEQWG